MAIQMRRGNEADLDISQLKAGEIAVCLDTGKTIIKLASENYMTLTDTPELREIVDGKSDVGHTHIKSEVGLGNVDNTSDLDKPVSNAVKTALDGKADSAHTHDDRYYTESEIDIKLDNKSDAGHTHLAKDITDLEIVTRDTGWQNLTLSSNFEAYNNSPANLPVYRVIGNIVQIKGNISPASTTVCGNLNGATYVPIGSLPDDIIPPLIPVYTVQHGSGADLWLSVVSTDGTLYATRYAGGSAYTSPITTTWMPFSITYLI